MSSERLDWRPGADVRMMRQRALLLKTIRRYFEQQQVLEVETPLLSHAATPDPHLESLQSRVGGQPAYLNTSPEFAMKRLLAAGIPAVYQICKAFREDVPGALHNPEFTLLEWYRTGYDMAALMQDVQTLVQHCHQALAAERPALPVHRLSYRQAFEATLGLDPHQADAGQCHALALQRGIEVPQGLGPDGAVDDWLDWFMLIAVAPAFDNRALTFLYDYPASQCSLARLGVDAQGQQVARRFELFYGEIELANGFEELTDAGEQARRFERDNDRRRQTGQAPVPQDRRFLAALASGMPDCSGVALGLDRLLMVLTGCDHIRQVLAFDWENA